MAAEGGGAAVTSGTARPHPQCTWHWIWTGRGLGFLLPGRSLKAPSRGGRFLEGTGHAFGESLSE